MTASVSSQETKTTVVSSPVCCLEAGKHDPKAIPTHKECTPTDPEPLACSCPSYFQYQMLSGPQTHLLVAFLRHLEALPRAKLHKASA